MINETILELLKRLPIDVLISFVSIFFVILAVFLIPFWVKRVERRMNDIHRLNTEVTAQGIKAGLVESRVWNLERTIDTHDEKLVVISSDLKVISSKMDGIKEGQERIMEKLNIV